MVTDLQVRELFEQLAGGATHKVAALRSGMSERTARKYLKTGKFPSEGKVDHTWRTREDPFSEVWEEIKGLLNASPGLESKTIFDWLCRKYPGKFQSGQLRTLQRKVKCWRALEGPPKEVYFPQEHHPARQSQSDFTNMNKLGITIAGEPFPHLLYHFVLTYSNWEWGKVCFSESFESLSGGLQDSLWVLGGVPTEHRTDRLSAAVHNDLSPEVFTKRYRALLSHYGLTVSATNPDSPNENGDVEQAHNRLKKAIDQLLMLRGNRDFESRTAYEQFLQQVFISRNALRQERFGEEQKLLQRLPDCKLPEYKRFECRVGPSSTIRIQHNRYSVPSRFRGEKVIVRLYAEHLELWYAQRCVETIPRKHGRYRYSINYRHIIDWLVRKPGAFENYRYHDALFPTSYFRITYDWLKERQPAKASREYLKILYVAALDSESKVNDLLRDFLSSGTLPKAELLKEALCGAPEKRIVPAVAVEAIDLNIYDTLLLEKNYDQESQSFPYEQPQGTSSTDYACLL